MPRALRRLLWVLSAFATTMSGCFGSCSGPQDFEPEAGCLADAPAGQVALVLGTDEGEGFRELSGETTLQMDYGPQGGQHVYYSVRVAGALEGDWIQSSLSDGGAGTDVAPLTACPDGQWSVISNDYIQLAQAEEITTTLTVKLLRCMETEPCDFYGEGSGPAAVAIAEASASIHALP